MGFPSLPGSVDRYVRQILDTMLGRTGNAGDRVVTYRDLADAGLLLPRSGGLGKPNRPGSGIGDSLIPNPNLPGGGVEDTRPKNPTAPEGLRAVGILGAIILEWQPANYQNHSRTEVHRAQVDDLSVATKVHESPTSLYTDLVDSFQIQYFYWIRHVSKSGKIGPFNKVGGTPGQASDDPTLIRDAIRKAIDKSYFTDAWAKHTEEQEELLKGLGDGVHELVSIAEDHALKISNVRNTVDGNTAQITEQKKVTDGLKAEYTLKVSHEDADGNQIVSGIGVASGQNEDGSPLSEIAFAADNFFFASPDGLKRPFSIVPYKDGGYAISMEAEVLINGRLNISNLDSGELQPGTALTIGDGSMEMSTASNGSGQMIITGQGGIQGNDFMLLNAGRITSYVWVPGKGHVLYKEVRRVESGVAQSGSQVKIPAYFKSEPIIHLSPRDFVVYNAEYPHQHQKMVLEYTPPVPDPREEGAWLFTPLANLRISDGQATDAIDWTYEGEHDNSWFSQTTFRGAEKVKIDLRVASYRILHTNTYQNQRVTARLFQRRWDQEENQWQLLTSQTIDIDGLGISTMQLEADIRDLDSYFYLIRFEAVDREGTFTDGFTVYEYQTLRKDAPTWQKSWTAHSGQLNINEYVRVNYVEPTWEPIKFEYHVEYTVRLRAWRVWDSDLVSGRLPYDGRTSVSSEDRSHSVIADNSLTTGHPSFFKEFYSDRLEVSKVDTTSLNGSHRFHVTLSRAGFDHGGEDMPSSYAFLRIDQAHAMVTYRRPTQNSHRRNFFSVDVVERELGELDISATSAVVRWTAISAE